MLQASDLGRLREWADDLSNDTHVGEHGWDCQLLRRVVAQVEADDALLLSLQWQGHEGCCPWCGRSKFDGHSGDCDMKLRSDQALARREVTP